jgi:hypothetical protein
MGILPNKPAFGKKRATAKKQRNKARRKENWFCHEWHQWSRISRGGGPVRGRSDCLSLFVFIRAIRGRTFSSWRLPLFLRFFAVAFEERGAEKNPASFDAGFSFQ